MAFVVDLAMRADCVSHIAKKALEESDTDDAPDVDTPRKLADTRPGPTITSLRRMRQELLELFFESAINNFETYVVSILREVLRKRPEILRTREQSVTIEYVLQFQSIQELTSELIEGKVNSLSYDGFDELYKWCSREKIPLAVSKDISKTIVELIATRNAIVHNRGEIDDKYLRIVKDSRFRKGEKRQITIDELHEALTILDRIVIATDQGAVAKYGLETFSSSQQT